MGDRWAGHPVITFETFLVSSWCTAFLISSAFRSGDVASRTTSTWNFFSSELFSLNHTVADSRDFGRTIGREFRGPVYQIMGAGIFGDRRISTASLLTAKQSNRSVSASCSRLIAISGLPVKVRRFLFLMPFDPPLAQVVQILLIGSPIFFSVRLCPLL